MSEFLSEIEIDGQIERVASMFDEAQLQGRVAELGRQISRDYAGQELVVVAVLKGAVQFFSDLIRCLDVELLRCDFLGLSSYGDRTTSSGVVRLTSDLTRPIEGKHVLIVEDIVDTGLTLRYLLDNFETRHPASLKICTLLHKPAGEVVKVPLDYVGFTIENRFVVGYGLDYDERYRQLRHIGVLSFGGS